MKILKRVLRIIVLTHIFPILIIAVAPKDEMLKAYFIGWIANAMAVVLILVVFFLMWLFEDDD